MKHLVSLEGLHALGQDILTDPLDNVGITFTNICSKNPELCAEGLSHVFQQC